MPKFTLNAEIANTLIDYHSQVQICDEIGNVIGTFRPQYNREPPRSLADIEKLRKSYKLSDCKTTE